MEVWAEVLAVVLPITVLVVLLILFLRRRRHRHIPPSASPDQSLEAGIAKLHSSCIKHSLRFHPLHQDHHHHHGRNRRPIHQEQLVFHWDDHPDLVAEAGENGWARFAFEDHLAPSPSATSRSPSLLGFCVVCESERRRQHPETEVTWEVPQGSLEFMQAIRLNPAPRRTAASAANDNNSSGPADDPSLCCYSSVKMGLPLPGPRLGDTSFPQEAYFEITVLYIQPSQAPPRGRKRGKGGDRLKLIFPGNPTETQSISASAGNDADEEEVAPGIVSLGLARGGFPNHKAPGSYSGSIGFSSDGSVHLDGTKLVSESEKFRWGAVNRVVGCGFDPRRKKVILTMDSELLHVVHCSSDTFLNPLYPTLASKDLDVMVLVNLGQKAFAYAPANARRTSNPCFLRSPANGTAESIRYDDSQELFSIGRPDASHWLEKSGTAKNKSINDMDNDQNGCAGDGVADSENGKKQNATRSCDYDSNSVAIDIDAQSDLFEIELRT